MSSAEHEQRIRALEAAVIELKSHLPAPNADRKQIVDDGVISETDHPLLPGIPPKASKRLKAKLSVVRRGRRDLGLSTTEWANLYLGEADG
jgi:hypothetical protein